MLGVRAENISCLGHLCLGNRLPPAFWTIIGLVSLMVIPVVLPVMVVMVMIVVIPMPFP